MRHKILLVDDDEDLLDLLEYNLCKEGYIVKTLSSSADALAIATSFKPDLAVLDLMMSPYNGIDICRLFRSADSLHNIYIFFLTAKADPYYQHAVYNVGGDEFVEKIVGLKPLLSKVASVLKNDFVIRKSAMKLRVGPLELFRGVETVYRDGSKIHFSKPEFEILFFLAQNPERRVSIAQIIKVLWGSKTFMDELSVRNFIESIQRKLGKDVLIEQKVNLFMLDIPPIKRR